MHEKDVPDAKPQADNLPSFDEVMGRLALLSGIKTQSALARELRLTPASVSDAKKRGPFPLAWAFSLARSLDISLDRILGIQSEERIADEHSWQHRALWAVEDPERVRVLRFGDQKGPLPPELILVPKRAARLSMGNGSWDLGEEVVGHYAFVADWLRSKGNPKDMVLMDVFGRSMEPDLRDGDTVLIDRGQVEIQAGRIYAVGIEDTAVAKWVEKRPGALLLRSSNGAEFPPLEIDMRGDLADTVHIIGRVIWWCREAR